MSQFRTSSGSARYYIMVVHRILRTAVPSFYLQRQFEERPNVCSACAHLLLVVAVLSLPGSCLVALHLAPALASLNGPELLEGAESVFPDGLDLVFNKSYLSLRPSVDSQPSEPGKGYVCWEDHSAWCTGRPSESLEPIRLELSSWLIDVLYSELPVPWGMTVAKFVSLLTGDSSWDEVLPNINEYMVCRLLRPVAAMLIPVSPAAEPPCSPPVPAPSRRFNYHFRPVCRFPLEKTPDALTVGWRGGMGAARAADLLLERWLATSQSRGCAPISEPKEVQVLGQARTNQRHPAKERHEVTTTTGHCSRS
jgi:hypothetical protein